MTELEANTVIASLYSGLKQRNRNKGFILLESPLKASPYNKIAADEKADLFDRLKTLLFDYTQKILSGDMEPHPAEVQLCYDCKWKTICRASHLT